MKAKNNPKPTADSICSVCEKPFAETHEIFFGPHRQLSIKHGIQVHLCAEHHRGPSGPHQNAQRNLQLKQQGQAWFERLYGHDEFMRIFGRNYL
jgi:hypothetical protein